ncbi:gcn5-related n-acetyltransferase [Flammeovirgaceae bacterium 311]|nr:gcn5-related n-acetyltransferase [Flammeovirgaceae bacterium 311]
MTELSLHIEPLTGGQQPPFDLLELADPSKAQINLYLESGICYVAKLGDQIIGVMVLDEVDNATIEIKNIAIRESAHGKGFGKLLLIYAEKISREQGYKKLLIGTGNSSVGQLALYQKVGFEMKRIKKGFFLKNYSKPIYENGIQCKHLVILEKKLNN